MTWAAHRVRKLPTTTTDKAMLYAALLEAEAIWRAELEKAFPDNAQEIELHFRLALGKQGSPLYAAYNARLAAAFAWASA